MQKERTAGRVARGVLLNRGDQKNRRLSERRKHGLGNRRGRGPFFYAHTISPKPSDTKDVVCLIRDFKRKSMSTAGPVGYDRAGRFGPLFQRAIMNSCTVSGRLTIRTSPNQP